jgi:hypothetical protein
MATLISASINLSKLDKTKIVRGKDGSQYYDLTISVNDTKNDYGQDVSIYDKQSKEQREAKEKKTFLGNGKIFWSSRPTEQNSPQPNQNTKSQADETDNLPF